MKMPEISPTISCDIELGKKLSFIDLDINIINEILRKNGLRDHQILGTQVTLSSDSGLKYDPKEDINLMNTGRYDSENQEILIILGTQLDRFSSSKDELFEDREIAAKYGMEDIFADYEDEEIVETMDLSVSIEASKTMLHEMSHLIDHKVKGARRIRREHKEYVDKVIDNAHKKMSIFLGSAALTSLITLVSEFDNHFIGKNAETIIGMNTISFIAMGLLNKRKSKKAIKFLSSHDGYLNRPDEKRAREFESDRISDLIHDDRLPIRIELP